jgi:hypothetical protein
VRASFFPRDARIFVVLTGKQVLGWRRTRAVDGTRVGLALNACGVRGVTRFECGAAQRNGMAETGVILSKNTLPRLGRQVL